MVSDDNLGRTGEPVTDRELELLRNKLRFAGVGSMIFGGAAVALGFGTRDVHPLNAVLMLIGLFLVVAGALLLVRPSKRGLIVDGIALLILGLWNLLIAQLNASGGAGGSWVGRALGICQCFWAVDCFRRYAKVRRGASLSPGADAGRLLVFFAIVYAFTWLRDVPMLLLSIESIWQVPFVSRVLIWSRGIFPHQLWWLVPVCPALVAVIASWVDRRKGGLRDLLTPLTRWRVGIGWWLVALVLPLAIQLATTAAFAIQHNVWPRFDSERTSQLLSPHFLYWSAAFAVACIGWFGYVWPRITSQRHPISAALGLGLLLWGIALPGSVQWLDNRPGLEVVWREMLSLVYWVATTILLSWIYLGTRKSLLLVVVFALGVQLNVLPNFVRFPDVVSSQSIPSWESYVRPLVALAVLVLGRKCFSRDSARTVPA